MISDETTRGYPFTRLARMAGVTDPDSATSPGAEFLDLVRRDYVSDVRTTSGDVDDAIHESADSCVPTYTHEMWTTFTDLCAYQEMDDVMLSVSADTVDRLAREAYTGRGSAVPVKSNDMEDLARQTLCGIATRLLYALRTDDDDDGDDETDDDDA